MYYVANDQVQEIIEYLAASNSSIHSILNSVEI